MVCTHRDAIKIEDIKPGSKGCEECLKSGDKWVHLGICLTCGHVGCCNQSKNKHATKHFEETGHPVIQSYQPGEYWKYCYIDSEYLQ